MSKQNDSDDYGGRMKEYEKQETERRLNISEPVYARIDGRAFSTFTRGMNKPHDLRLSQAMIETTKYLVHKTHASDEISLIWLTDQNDATSSLFFDAKIQKMCSILAAMTTAKFIMSVPTEFQERLPHFDARVLNLPSKIEAANMLLWRAMDAKKNGIQAAAQSKFSHKQLQGKDQKQMLEMLSGIGVDFEYQYAPHFKEGSFIQKRNVERMLTVEELEEIPEKFRPTKSVIRSEYPRLNMSLFNTVKNRVEVIFDSEEPKVS